MADTIFTMMVPRLRAKDLGDGTFAMAVASVPASGTDSVFKDTSPRLKAVDTGEVDSNGDKIYAVAAVMV